MATMRALNGGPTEVARFTDRALKRVGAPLENSGQHHLVHLDAMPDAIKERLEARGLHGTRRVGFDDDPVPGVTHLGRVHPLVAGLAEGLAEGALDPAGRVPAAWPLPAPGEPDAVTADDDALAAAPSFQADHQRPDESAAAGRRGDRARLWGRVFGSLC